METVWITGASSGIGEACAYRWAEGGARLVITAPTAEELEPVAAFKEIKERLDRGEYDKPIPDVSLYK